MGKLVMRIGFDLDGVLYDFGESVRRYLASIGRPVYWKESVGEAHDWDFYEHWEMTRDQFTQVCHDGVDAGFIFSGPARNNARDAVRRASNFGDIIIITDRQFGSRPENSHAATEAWLKEHDIHYDELVFSADKTCVPTDIFVEDKLQNYDALTAAGTECWLINRPWNNVGPDNRSRINDVLEYPSKVSLAYTSRVVARL